jgi:hypothetical protein
LREGTLLVYLDIKKIGSDVHQRESINQHRDEQHSFQKANLA